MSGIVRAAPRLELTLHEKQRWAFECPADEILYGGAAGGGKSGLMRSAAVLWCLQIPGLQCYLFRRVQEDIIKNHLHGKFNFREILAPLTSSGHAKVVMSQKKIIFWNGSVIHLCYMERAKDFERYQGAEIHLLLIDEATHFTDDEYRKLRSRLRGVPFIPPYVNAKFPRVLMGTNPGGRGHAWCKKGFVNGGAYILRQMPKGEGGMLRCYIPAKLEDNPTIDIGYEDKLEGMGSASLVRAMRDGDWSVIAGAMFGEVWRDARHMCDPFAIPSDWKVWRGGDDGFAAPSAVIWFAQDRKTKTVYVIAEYYKAGVLADELAQRVLNQDRKIPRIDSEGAKYESADELQGIYDSSGFNQQGHGGKGRNAVEPRAVEMNRLGCNWRKAQKPKNCRQDSIKHIHKLLAPNALEEKDENGVPYPGLIFFRGKCPRVVEQMTELLVDENDPEDVDDKQEDHAFDALRYGLQYVTDFRSKVEFKGL